MYKIDYPQNRADLALFEEAYYNSLSKKNESRINLELNKVNCPHGKPLDFKRLVTMKFEDLIRVENSILSHIKTLPVVQKMNKSNKVYDTTDFEEYFNYGDNQGRIANFFMGSKELKLKTCYYCNLSFINAFSQFPNYKNKKEFINNGKAHELMFVKGIDEAEAQKIISGRPYRNGSDPKLGVSALKLLKKFNFSKKHNHFTLDHVLPQSISKFFSLCLYNFVPSCYSCNSKFKKALDFKGLKSDLKYISPTSPDFSFAKDYEFEIVFSKNHRHVKTVDDFIIKDKIKGNEDHIGSYLRMFKIMGRYTFHKDIILDLVQNKVKYPDSLIRRMSKKTGVSQKELRRRIFGEELFIKSNNIEPFVKFKRDVAKQLKIKGVLKE